MGKVGHNQIRFPASVKFISRKTVVFLIFYETINIASNLVFPA